MIVWLKHALPLIRDCRGVTALEYALIAGLIAVVIVGAVTTLGDHVSAVLVKVGSDVNT